MDFAIMVSWIDAAVVPFKDELMRILDATPFLPAKPDASLKQHHAAAEKCRGCELYKNATQVVFGEGGQQSEVMFIGEQPGDQEDQQGKPFVGPAGRILDQGLADAKIDRTKVYVTNAVKHFKWKPAPRGKRRIHSKPSSGEIRACQPWLLREISLVKPAVIVCLGVTAGQSLFGSPFKLGEMRSKPIRDTQWAPCVIATSHPSALLRIPDPNDKRREYERFVQDLKLVALELRSKKR